MAKFLEKMAEIAHADSISLYEPPQFVSKHPLINEYNELWRCSNLYEVYDLDDEGNFKFERDYLGKIVKPLTKWVRVINLDSYEDILLDMMDRHGVETVNAFCNSGIQLKTSENQKSQKSSLSFTKYHYGFITYTTQKPNEYQDWVDKKQQKKIDKYEKAAITYLTNIYNVYFSKKEYNDFLANCYIERAPHGMVHLHVLYKRKLNWFNSKTPFLRKNATIKKEYRLDYEKVFTDEHLLNLMNYDYDNPKDGSKVLHRFEFQFNNLE